MCKTICPMLTMLLILAGAALARAEEPKSEPSGKEGIEQRQQQRKQAFKEAVAAKDFDKAMEVMEEMLNDKDSSDQDRLAAACTQFKILATKKLDGAKACAMGKKIMEMKPNEAQLLNTLAWMLLDTPNLKNCDMDVVLAIAKQAAEATKYENSTILDTLARAYFEKGELDKAVEFQSKAVEKLDADPQATDEVKAKVKETLEKYKAAKAKKNG